MLYLGVLQFSLEIPHSASLKDKRSVVRRLKDTLRRQFNISISEFDDLDSWSVATLGAVMAGSDVQYMNAALDKLIDVLDNDRDAVLIDHQLEIISART